jgi:acetylglutamate kinase
MELDPVVKSKVLLEALPYLQRFRGSIFVIKYGGSFMDDPDPEVRTRVARDVACLAAVGILPVVVHGGGKAITEALSKSGIETVFNRGLRVTDGETVKVVEDTLFGKINGEICSYIRQHHGNPQGINGRTLLVCKKQTRDDQGNEVDLGFVGRITAVKTKLIKKMLKDGFIPVVSPIGSDEDGQAYNINADVAAAHVAAALRARRLVFLSDVPGLLRDFNDPSSLISTLKISEVENLVNEGVIAKGMLPKVRSGVEALRAGVHRVHFVDGRMPHSVLLEIFTDQGVGTEIVNA